MRAVKLTLSSEVAGTEIDLTETRHRRSIAEKRKLFIRGGLISTKRLIPQY